jgi:hypothetical protein
MYCCYAVLSEHSDGQIFTKETAMTSVRWLTLLTLVTGILIGLAAQESHLAAKPEAAAADGLDVHYAELYLSLMKVQLQRSLDTNQQIPGTLGSTIIDAQRQSVNAAEKQLELLKGGRRLNVFLICAEANQNASRTAYERAVAVNRQSPGVIPAAEIEVLRLTAELDQVEVDRAKTASNQSPQNFLQWQVDELREEIFQLRNQPARTARFN